MNLPHGSHFGLIAQDVEKVLPDLVADTKFETAMAQSQATEGALQQTQEAGETETQSEIIEFKALNYTELIPVLIKGMQELNDELKSEIRNLKSDMRELKEMMDVRQSTTNLSSVSLEQNTPNPFTNSTTITYTLPEKFTTAQIVINDKNGKAVKQVSISGTGRGTLSIDAASLASGVYSYSLMVDGKMIGSKQMILTR
jgi:hypothetical protein